MHEETKQDVPLTQSEPVEIPQPPDRASWKSNFAEEDVKEPENGIDTSLPERLTW